ncbi:MAG: hypothetical protein JWM11_811 [Planctomycetaceae bacterium]|nr:hypothetical protein [Planctomycetaceae bacterium]
MGQTLQTRLQPVHFRQQLMRAIGMAAWGLLAGSTAGIVFALVKYLVTPDLSVWVPAALALTGLVVGFIVGAAWRRDLRSAALAVDSHYTLKDRATTALEFSKQPEMSVIHQLAFADALSHLEQVKPRDVVPLKMPRVLPYALATLATSVVLVVLATWNAPVSAGTPEPLEVVVAQADRLTEELKQLEEFATREKDEEVEKLVKELKAAIEELKQPGMDERDALAKLSEMQAALQSQQEKYNAAAVDAQLSAVGEALSLAEPLSEAGKALSSSQHEKAAELLEKSELPELNRQTEKAIKEKLDQAAKQMSESGQNSLSQATGDLSKGLGGDSKKFSEASKKLAGECRKQGKRKKLTDLLQRQCNCLGECKSECEGECKSSAKGLSKKKGGTKAGLAGTGGELGEQTAQFGNKKMEKITGKQSAEGETEVETTHSPEGTQQAERSYRENYAKYKKISESVLDSEPIPLGHRQTIRRYFGSIRPNDAETDKVGAATQEKK